MALFKKLTFRIGKVKDLDKDKPREKTQKEHDEELRKKFGVGPKVFT